MIDRVYDFYFETARMQPKCNSVTATPATLQVRLFLLFRDAVITCIVNTCTCLTAGVLVFSILGYMAHLQGVGVDDVARSGPGLVFLTYPELVLTLNGSFIWAILFFAMLLVSM